MREAVVLVPGVWMGSWTMAYMRRYLRTCDYSAYAFGYPSLRYTPRKNARLLDAYVKQMDADIVHFVAHSLGGIVVMHLFEQDPAQKPGRVLLLGTPLNGSGLARRIYSIPLLRILLGNSADRGLLGGVPPWDGGRELGMIAGNRGFGVGKFFFGGLTGVNDGTVALAETRTPAVNVHLTVPYSHMGMLFSRPVALAVYHFLRYGDFTGANE